MVTAPESPVRASGNQRGSEAATRGADDDSYVPQRFDEREDKAGREVNGTFLPKSQRRRKRGRGLCSRKLLVSAVSK